MNKYERAEFLLDEINDAAALIRKVNSLLNTLSDLIIIDLQELAALVEEENEEN